MSHPHACAPTGRLAVGMISLAMLSLAGCPAPPDGPDLFRTATSGAPGALLSVWGDPAGTAHAFLAGGYVQVDPAAIVDGTVGRLVEYTPGTFVTRCRTDHVLWWVSGAPDGSAVFAAGEGGRVVRYRRGTCETLTFDVTYPEGAPTFFGAYAAAPDDVWFVGGSALPNGPRGVLVHWDGAAFHQETGLPVAAQHANLFKIDRDQSGRFVVVGTQGVAIARDPSTGAWASLASDVRTSDNTFFTVSCRADCYTVGGIGLGLVARISSGVTMLTSVGTIPVDELPGLNGVFMQDPSNAFIVGTRGYTMHTTGAVSYSPPTAPTTATLHGVGGNARVVLAAGGELGVTDASQRGVILVRGDDSATFTFDGVAFVASGSLRTSLGGAGQGR
ncbi:MAG: hypothetical protein WCJ30_14535 [Deltaproteobacteria bacterium]